jgi:hypothetical protein
MKKRYSFARSLSFALTLSLLLGGFLAGAPPAGAADWTPADTNVALWLDADDASTLLLNGGSVSNWLDKSGNTRHATEATPANQPTDTAGGLNGKHVLTFDGAADRFDIDLDFLAGVDHSAFIVTKPTGYTDIYGARTVGGSNDQRLHVGFRGSSSEYRMNFWAHDWYGTVSTNFHLGQGNILNYVWVVGSPKEIFANGTSEGNSGGQLAATIGTMSGGGSIVWRTTRSTGNRAMVAPWKSHR